MASDCTYHAHDGDDHDGDEANIDDHDGGENADMSLRCGWKAALRKGGAAQVSCARACWQFALSPFAI
eukprot:3903878-Pyramimonas_sp.AAC.1